MLLIRDISIFTRSRFFYLNKIKMANFNQSSNGDTLKPKFSASLGCSHNFDPFERRVVCCKIKLQCITAMNAYSESSFEELRLENVNDDMTSKRTGTQAETCRTSPDLESRKRKIENKDKADEVKMIKLQEMFEQLNN